MLPKNPTTIRSSRAPKIKEPETSEGSSPRTMRQLEYVPRLKPVIKTTTKKVLIQPSAFGDTEERNGSKVSLPQWGDLFNMIIREEYLEYVPHNESDIRALNN
jgi:hypothetical protein